MAGYFYPNNLLFSEPFQCLRGGRERRQALHLSSSLCLWCEAVAGACVCVCLSRWHSQHTADAPCTYSHTSWWLLPSANGEQPVFCLVTLSVWLLPSQVCFKAWQRVGAVHKKSLILLSASSCMEFLGAREFMQPTLCLVRVLHIVEIRPKAGMWLAFHLPELPQPHAQLYQLLRLYCDCQDTW